MVYEVYTDMSRCTELDIDRLCAIVPPQRLAYAMRYKHVFGRWTALKAWEMVDEVVGNHEEWLVSDKGKPYFANGPYFSISHCKHGIAVAVDDQPIGIDMESIRSVDDSLIAYTMNEEEQKHIHQSDNPAATFTRLWTQKEALLKCAGTGIVTDLHAVLTRRDGVDIKTEECIAEGYIVSWCTTKKDGAK